MCLIIAFFALAAILGLFTRGQKYHTYFTYIPSAFASFLTIILSLVIFSSESIHLTFFNIQDLFDFEIFIDGVAAFFLLIIGLISFAVSIYSLSYSKKFDDKKNNSALGMLFNVFIISMILVVISNGAFFLLVSAELMFLSAFHLGFYERENKNNLK